MPRIFDLFRNRPFQLYLLGLLCIFGGAWAMAEYRSMVPMALASSASLILSAPLLRQLLLRMRRCPRTDDRKRL